MASDRKLLLSKAGVELWEISLRSDGGVVMSGYHGKTRRVPDVFDDARRPQAEAWFHQEVARVLGQADPNAPRWPAP
jgi:hypothetical protein